MRWLGLRLRIALTLVAAVAGACWALTATTTQWAAGNRDEQLVRLVERDVGVDLDWVQAGVKDNPNARSVADFRVERANAGSDPATEGAVIPIESATAGIRPELADQYSFVDATVPLKDRIPECLVPPGYERAMDYELEPESAVLVSRQCGEHVLAYAFARAVADAKVPYWLVIRAIDSEALGDPVPELRDTLVKYSAIISLAALAIAGVLAAALARPLSRARQMAEAVAGGDLSVRIPVQGRDEVARLSTAVNTMADRLTSQITELQHANDVQKRFVADVAHELRTPTSALLASAEALENPATRDEAATLVVPQLRRLAGLTEDLLEISRMDAGRALAVPSRIDLVDLLAEVVGEVGGSGIAIAGPTTLEVTTDPARLRVVVRNLLANAVQHGAPPVNVTLARTKAGIVLSVEDAGPGVPADLGDRVFDRFVRGDEARHGSSSGLGLAIAQENAKLLGGSLTLRPDGRTFVLDLPHDVA